MMEDLDQGRKRLGPFLLRQGEGWRGGSAWPLRHEAWLRSRHFEDKRWRRRSPATGPCSRTAPSPLTPSRPTSPGRRAPFVDGLARVPAYRGVARSGALTLAAEVRDWGRFGRAGAFTGSQAWCPRRTRAEGGPIAGSDLRQRAELSDEAAARVLGAVGEVEAQLGLLGARPPAERGRPARPAPDPGDRSERRVREGPRGSTASTKGREGRQRRGRGRRSTEAATVISCSSKTITPSRTGPRASTAQGSSLSGPPWRF